jgi:hypothetical protein
VPLGLVRVEKVGRRGDRAAAASRRELLRKPNRIPVVREPLRLGFGRDFGLRVDRAATEPGSE